MLNYKQDEAIDIHSLDMEWLRQADTFAKYAEQLAEAEAVIKRKNEKLKLLAAELTEQINKSVEAYLGEGVKATVANVEAYILRYPEYKLLKEELIDLEFEKDILLVAVQAMRMKCTALENLVRLHGQSYFGSPKEPKESAGFQDKAISKAADHKVKTAISRRNK